MCFKLRNPPAIEPVILCCNLMFSKLGHSLDK